MSIQTILRIETVNNRVIELMQVGEEYRIDSRHVAPNLDIEHDSFIKTLQTYQVQLEHFGLLRFEIEAVKTATSRGTKYAKYALLNRNQILFAITLSRNTEQVTLWKMAMIDALDQLEKQLTQHAHPVAAALKQGVLLEPSPDLAQEWEWFLLAWQDCFKHAWVPTAQLAAKIKGNPTHPLAKCLPAPLKTATTEEGFSIRLGKALYSRVEVLYGTLRIECSRHSHTKKRLWRVLPTIRVSPYSLSQ